MDIVNIYDQIYCVLKTTLKVGQSRKCKEANIETVNIHTVALTVMSKQ